MKIIYLIAGTYRAAGMERVLTTKANWLADHGHDILIITTDQNERPSAFKLNPSIRTADLGIGYEDNNGGSLPNKAIRYPFKLLKHRRRLTALLNSEHADVTVSMFCNDASFLPSIKDGSKKVLEVHFSRFKRLQYGRKGLWAAADRIRTAADLKTARRFDRFVVLTHEDAAYWCGLKNICVIPNPRTFSCGTPALLENHQAIAVGRYVHQKGFDRLLKAWRLIATDGWTLRIAGEGNLKAIEESGNIPDNVVLGHSDDIRSEMLESSLFILSSRYEGLPMALLEAQACGLPSVCFNCKCGPKDIITDGGNGRLVPEGNIDGLAEAMEKLMHDAALRERMGAAAYANSGKYDIETIMPLWEKLFAAL